MSTLNKKEEQEVLYRVQTGDRSAFEELYDAYSAAIFGMVTKILQSDEAAQDVTQETFVKIWKHIHSYDSKKGKLFTWMLNIARNTAIDALRKTGNVGQRKIQNYDPAVHISKGGTTEHPVNTIGLQDFVDKLAPDYRIIVEYIYFNGYTQKEVSEELGIPLGTVKTRIRKAVQDLRKIFKLLLFWI